MAVSEQDRRFMAACLRYGRRNGGLTGANPCVSTLLVKEGEIIGRGITAAGGRPHSEILALEDATGATGATAYVSLEPCAHEGKTPSCAQALIDAGVKRVVSALVDPDPRTDGKGHDMLERAQVRVDTGCLRESALREMAPWLIAKRENRAHVTLKLAVSKDGFLGREGERTPITDSLAMMYAHGLRARSDAILIGGETLRRDDPRLTCRLPGLEARSPKRFVLSRAGISDSSALVKTAEHAPIYVLTDKAGASGAGKNAIVWEIASKGGKLDLAEILAKMKREGIMSLLVEGGRKTAQSFLDWELVDRIALFSSSKELAPDSKGIVSPVRLEKPPKGFKKYGGLNLGADRLDMFEKK